jgi:hypothetical protein
MVEVGAAVLDKLPHLLVLNPWPAVAAQPRETQVGTVGDGAQAPPANFERVSLGHRPRG